MGVRPPVCWIAAALCLSFAGICVSGCGALADARRHNAEWAKCDNQRTPKPTPSERLSACNYVIAAGPSGARINDRANKTRYVGGFWNRAQVNAKLGRYDSSLQDFDRYFELSERYNVTKLLWSNGYHIRASVHFLFQKYDAAKRDLQRSQDVDPFDFSHEGARQAPLRGDIAMQEGNYEAAKRYYALAVKRIKNGESSYGGKLALAERMIANPPAAPASPAPGQAPHPAPIIEKSDSAACKMFPNLC
jgi:tetratricopeptide (TPR) repeat protein